MSIDYKDIGQRIKRLRVERGLTQERLSEAIGVGPSHMSHIESGSTVPSLEVFISILNVLCLWFTASICEYVCLFISLPR